MANNLFIATGRTGVTVSTYLCGIAGSGDTANACVFGGTNGPIVHGADFRAGGGAECGSLCGIRVGGPGKTGCARYRQNQQHEDAVATHI